MRVSALTPDVACELHYRDAMSTDLSGAVRLGALIKQARLEHGWTQQTLADEASVSIETVKRYENAKTKSPEPDPVRRICHALNIDVREIPVALGLVSREEMQLPPPPVRRFSPTVELLIEAIENPAVSDAERHAILALLRARDDRPPPSPSQHQQAG